MTQTLNKFLISPPPDVNLNILPDRLRSKLLPFQAEGVKFAVSKSGRQVTTQYPYDAMFYIKNSLSENCCTQDVVSVLP